ncbi:MAG TPA: PIN domain-containing protein [Longilinea sp.]|nr:PIN domain-containing protein [Longilinea sp.]
MPKVELFFDSSALIAGIASKTGGAAQTLLRLAEIKKIDIIVSEQVVAEVERNLAHKFPQALPFGREIIRTCMAKIVRDPTLEDVKEHLDWMSHAADVPILLAAVQAGVGHLVTLNTRHFIDDPGVAQRSGLIISTPGDALVKIRELVK